MIKIIGVTQRVDYIENYNERRDSLDQNWHLFFSKINYFPILLILIHLIKQLIKNSSTYQVNIQND